MTNFSVRLGAAFTLAVGCAVACSGSTFSASGGGSGSGGALASGGAGQAGGAQGGSSQAGGSQAGTSQGQGGGGATSQGGSGHAGSGQGGHPAAGAGGVSTGGTVGSAGSAGAGGVHNSGDCNLDKDCGTTGKCVALSVGGFRTCVLPVPPPTTCSSTDSCCVNSPDKPNCSMGTCVAGPLSPSCGLVTTNGNVCAVSQCALNTDCSGSNAICVPAGSLDRKVNTCLTGGCRRDSECNAEAGGKCEPVTNHCCNGITGLYCVYPSTGCRSQADCASGICQIVNDRADCTMGVGVCPG